MAEHTAARLHRRLLVVVGVILVVTATSMALLWPRADRLPEIDQAPMDDLVTGEVVALEAFQGEPDPVLDTDGQMLRLRVELQDGPHQGQEEIFEIMPDGYPEFRVGDRLALAPSTIPDDDARYRISDFQRTSALLVLVGLFSLAVVAIGRWHGLRSLLGLALSLLIVVRFIVPAILSGQSPPLVALVGAVAVMIVTLYLAHGVNEMTTSAVIGTTAALTLTVGLGLYFISYASISGFASDDAVYARFAVGDLDLRGLVLAGLIIAALGVLDDVTVSQSSTVFALHDTDRTLSWATLFARAMKVGRDHIASVVNTLFLAYAGASLALLVLFSTSGLPAGELINSEIMAEEIIKTVVGSLGLIAAVPFTTALAALVAVSRAPGAPPLGGGHLHGPVVGGPAREPGPRTLSTGADQGSGAGGRAEPRGAVAVDPADEELDEDERARQAWARYLARQQEASDERGGVDDERGS